MGIDAMMFITTSTPVTDAQIDIWCGALVAEFGDDPILTDEHDDGWRVLQRVKQGSFIPGPQGSEALELQLWGRYYGRDYERGTLPPYVAIAEWLERNIPGSTIWFGGDSVAIRLFDKEERDALMKHWKAYGNWISQREAKKCGGEVVE